MVYERGWKRYRDREHRVRYSVLVGIESSHRGKGHGQSGRGRRAVCTGSTVIRTGAVSAGVMWTEENGEEEKTKQNERKKKMVRTVVTTQLPWQRVDDVAAVSPVRVGARGGGEPFAVDDGNIGNRRRRRRRLDDDYDAQGAPLVSSTHARFAVSSLRRCRSARCAAFESVTPVACVHLRTTDTRRAHTRAGARAYSTVGTYGIHTPRPGPTTLVVGAVQHLYYNIRFFLFLYSFSL